MLARLIQSPVRGEGDEGTHLAVQPIGSLQIVLGDLDRRQFSVSYGCRLLQRSKIVNVGHYRTVGPRREDI
ncbi:hypothetical protein Misp02_49510 [Microtetraspora sp. NBRC 16547]|nr:hypothetical protein Misp02_49510 [Microtetraspora sp. NBRC 16547]